MKKIGAHAGIDCQPARGGPRVVDVDRFAARSSDTAITLPFDLQGRTTAEVDEELIADELALFTDSTELDLRASGEQVKSGGGDVAGYPRVHGVALAGRVLNEALRAGVAAAHLVEPSRHHRRRLQASRTREQAVGSLECQPVRQRPLVMDPRADSRARELVGDRVVHQIGDVRPRDALERAPLDQHAGAERLSAARGEGQPALDAGRRLVERGPRATRIAAFL